MRLREQTVLLCADCRESRFRCSRTTAFRGDVAHNHRNAAAASTLQDVGSHRLTSGTVIVHKLHYDGTIP